MKRTLIVATTSYAGMGPYVSEIVNTFSPEDDVFFSFMIMKTNSLKKISKKNCMIKVYSIKRQTPRKISL